MSVPFATFIISFGNLSKTACGNSRLSGIASKRNFIVYLSSVALAFVKLAVTGCSTFSSALAFSFFSTFSSALASSFFSTFSLALTFPFSLTVVEFTFSSCAKFVFGRTDINIAQIKTLEINFFIFNPP